MGPRGALSMASQLSARSRSLRREFPGGALIPERALGKESSSFRMERLSFSVSPGALPESGKIRLPPWRARAFPRHKTPGSGRSVRALRWSAGREPQFPPEIFLCIRRAQGAFLETPPEEKSRGRQRGERMGEHAASSSSMAPERALSPAAASLTL